jgi:hypothetical protein
MVSEIHPSYVGSFVDLSDGLLCPRVCLYPEVVTLIF